MTNFESARPNEAKLQRTFEECGADWEEIAQSLLSYMSDDDVGEWARLNGYLQEYEDEYEDEYEN